MTDRQGERGRQRGRRTRRRSRRRCRRGEVEIEGGRKGDVHPIRKRS